MPCPYAERRGAAIYCKAAGRKVNPLAFPCLTNRYTKCKYYKPPEEKPAPTAPAMPPPQRPVQPPPAPTPPPVTSTFTVQPRGEVKGITLDGRKPRDCTECIYYGAKTSTCLLLGVTVQDPRDPPCAKT